MSENSSVGIRLKARRAEMGISLRDLAGRTELTASFLSQVERSKTNVSLDSLRRIAETLDVPLLYFLSENNANDSVLIVPRVTQNYSTEAQDYSPVVREAYRPKLFLPLSGVVYEKLTPDMGRKMEVFCGHLSPGKGNVARKLREPTEEFIYVLSGSLMVGLDSGEYILKTGDSIYFEGAQLKQLVCASNEDASWLSAITPPVF